MIYENKRSPNNVFISFMCKPLPNNECANNYIVILYRNLFRISGVKGVMFGPDFITVTKVCFDDQYTY